jgi:hypothetical protein
LLSGNLYIITTSKQIGDPYSEFFLHVVSYH